MPHIGLCSENGKSKDKIATPDEVQPHLPTAVPLQLNDSIADENSGSDEKKKGKKRTPKKKKKNGSDHKTFQESNREDREIHQIETMQEELLQIVLHGDENVSALQITPTVTSTKTKRSSISVERASTEMESMDMDEQITAEVSSTKDLQQTGSMGGDDEQFVEHVQHGGEQSALVTTMLKDLVQRVHHDEVNVSALQITPRVALTKEAYMDEANLTSTPRRNEESSRKRKIPLSLLSNDGNVDLNVSKENVWNFKIPKKIFFDDTISKTISRTISKIPLG